MPDAVHLGSGKVRELYALDDERLLLVASDRISTFDVVLPTAIPDKGRVLTGMSAFWFARTARHLRQSPARAPARRPLHRVPPARDAADRVRGARLPLRLRLEGLRQHRQVCGHRLPAGLRESDRLPEPIFTPATKATSGHDENITRAQAAQMVGAERFAEAERLSIALYRFAAAYARERGIIIADTKFEFGVDRDGRLVLGDEALTPDSSRFWPADQYAPGGPQPSYDKQYVRDYCEKIGWGKTYPGPELPADVVTGTRRRYVEAFEQLTGLSFDAYLANPSIALK